MKLQQKMKCVGFGSVQALWLGRLWYKERWQQAVDGKKHGFHIFRPQPRTSHNALRNHTTLSLRMPSLLKNLRPRSLSVLFQVWKMWLLTVTFFFPSVVVFYSSVCVHVPVCQQQLLPSVASLNDAPQPCSPSHPVGDPERECMRVSLCTYV